jgi:dolichol-phosphate mannosyltransferase
MLQINSTSLEKKTSFSSIQLKRTRSVTVVIPAFNEVGNLEKLLLTLQETFENLEFTLPVLLIDDGSTDGSAEILHAMSEEYAFLQIIHHSQRQGVTGVWKTALAHVKTDWIFWGQADLESDPRTDLPLLLEACTPECDAVAGWRQKRGDGKIFASKFANFACRLLFGLKIHDMNWIKLVRRDLLLTLPIEKITHRYLLAVLAAQGHNITEVATPWHPRYAGTSKFGKKRLLTSALDFAKVWWWFKTEGYVNNRRYQQQKTGVRNYVGVSNQRAV